MTQGGKRPTKAERKEQARQQRLAEMKRRQRRARMRKIWIGVVSAIIVAGVVGLIFLSGKKNRATVGELNKLAAAAGCTEVQEPKDLGAGHVNPPQTVQYNSKPPTSGQHYPSTTATGIHTTPVQNETQVHNLEHGNVFIQYKPDVDQALIDKIEDLGKVDDTRIIVAPYADMDAKLAVTSWGKIATCATATDAFVPFARRFFDVNKGKGPEGDIPGKPA